MAEATTAAGITGTGETGDDVPNDLPAVRDAYLEFRRDPQAYAARHAPSAPPAPAGRVAAGSRRAPTGEPRRAPSANTAEEAA